MPRPILHVTEVARCNLVDAPNIAYGLRKLGMGSRVKAVYEHGGIVSIEHTGNPLSEGVKKNVDCFVRGYELARELP